MRSLFWIGALLFAAIAPASGQAQSVGTLGPSAQAITPSDEGNLLVIKPAAAGLPVYTLVPSGGKAVIIMTPEGNALTPRQAWETYGGQAKAPAAAFAPPRGGTFSIPNAHP